MNVLALESATSLVGAAVWGDDGLRAVRAQQGGRRHAEELAPAVVEVCDEAGVSLREVDAIAVDAGPGLFTGLRVGVATAKALAQALGVGVLGVRSLEVLAAEALDREPPRGATVVAVVDARRGEVFVARYGPAVGEGDNLDPGVLALGPPERRTPDQLAEDLRQLAEGPGRAGPGWPGAVLVGDGAARYAEALDGVEGVDLRLLSGATPVVSPSPARLAGLAHARLESGTAPLAPADVVPEYLREADARINWDRRVAPVVPGASPGS